MERLKKYMQLLNVQNTEKERKQILELQRKEIKEQIDVLIETLKKLDYKIDNYERIMS